MACVKCGFAASNLSAASKCPSCLRLAQRDASVASVWPPPPMGTAPDTAARFDADAVKQQRQTGILMDVGAMAVVYLAAQIAHALQAPYGSLLLAVALIGSLYPHFRGSAHWAESKGYPRRTGRIIGLVGWLGPIILALMPDKNTGSA